MKARLFASLVILALCLTVTSPALAAALGPGFYRAPDPNISYTNITGIGYHASGDPIYYFDAASWSVAGADQVQVLKNVYAGGGTLCMDGTTCQSFGYTTTFIAMDLPDRGVHSFVMTNGAITFLSVVYDGTPPVTTATLTGTPGANGWYRSAVTVAASATDPAGSPPSSLASGVASTTLDGSPYTGPITVSAEGATTVTYASTDHKGNVEANKSVSVTIDAQPPATTAALTGTRGDNGWYVSPVILALDAVDSTSGVADTSLDGARYSGPVTLSAAGTAAHTFYSTDVAGNIEATQSQAVKIDTDQPSGTLVSPASGQIARGTVTLAGTAADATSGLASVQVSTDGGGTWQDAVLNGGAWSFPTDTTTLGDGPAVLQARARDLAGNVQTFASANLTVDNTPPVVTLAASGTQLCLGCGLGNTLSLDYAGSDATTGLASWSLSVDGGPTLASGAASTTSAYTWDGSGLAPGPQVLRFRATDGAGNTSEATVSVSLIAPSRTVTHQQILFPATSLTGLPQTVTATAPSSAWTVFNSFPAGTGWRVQIALTDLTAGGHVIPASNMSVRLAAAAITGQAGATAYPDSLVPVFTPLSNAPLTLLSASGPDGIGAYAFTPEFQLTIPADAHADNYTAAVTVTILAGP